MNLGEIQSALYDTLGYQATPDSAVTRKLNREINLAQRMILGKKGFGVLRRRVLTFASVANSQVAVLPQAATRIVCIVDRTNNRLLDPTSLQAIRRQDPALAFTSVIPDEYSILTYNSPVALDPSAATQLYVISDSASDSSAIAVYVEGIVTGGYPRRAQIGLNGTTAVAVDSSTAWIAVNKFYISAPATGNVTLRMTSGVGTELARITAGRSFARYTQILLAGVPGSAITYYADVEIHVEDMINPRDEPLLPEDFHWLLECGALRKEYQKKEKIPLWTVEERRWKEGLDDLKVWISRQGGAGKGGQAGSNAWSQLGANFAAGS